MQSSIFLRTCLLNEDSKLSINNRADLNIRRPENLPDIEVIPTHHRANNARVDPILDKIGAFNLLAILVQPKSHGSVRLRSSNPSERPVVNLGFFTDPQDIVVLREGLRFALKLGHQMTLEGCPLKPISSQLPASESDEDMDNHIRENVRSCLHYTSTCRMAPEEDPNPGVVDDELRVHGIEGLRIADTSIFPDIISTHTMAGAVVVAEKCAQMILQRD
jgi:choline dehydrogenase-like flavoprotein